MKLGPSGLALAAAAATFGVSMAIAQTAPPPTQPPAQPPFANPPYKNLKVFPKDISGAQLISNMKGFAQALGVRCTYCHVGEEGKPMSTFDFASDAKDKKLTARAMLLMAHRINQQDFDGQMKVTCFTCHRGSTDAPTAPPPGMPPPPKSPERG